MTEETEQAPASPSHCQKTLGEELFLVHLDRFSKQQPSPDDFDREKSKQASEATSATVGEELWMLHCKRRKTLLRVLPLSRRLGHLCHWVERSS
jgi:hypothetical protein